MSEELAKPAQKAEVVVETVVPKEKSEIEQILEEAGVGIFPIEQDEKPRPPDKATRKLIQMVIKRSEKE